MVVIVSSLSGKCIKEVCLANNADPNPQTETKPGPGHQDHSKSKSLAVHEDNTPSSASSYDCQTSRKGQRPLEPRGQPQAKAQSTIQQSASHSMQQVLCLKNMEPSAKTPRTRKLGKKDVERANELRRRGGACDDCRRLKIRVMLNFPPSMVS